ncbi:MAG: endopeptidase La, partial [bacterium]
MAENGGKNKGAVASAEKSLNYPLLPLRDIVIFPNMIVPLFIGRAKSIKALEECMVSDRRIVVVAQHEAGTEEPTEEELYRVGCLSEVLNMVKLPDGTIKALLEGHSRVRIREYLVSDAYFVARVDTIAETAAKNIRVEALMRDVLYKFDRYIRLTRTLPPEAYTSASSIDDPCRLADLIASQIVLKVADKQRILESDESETRLEILSGILEHELEIIDIQKKIQSQVKKQIEQTQKEYYLKEQLKAIHKELGEEDEKTEEIVEIRRKMKKAKMPKYAEEKVESELKRLMKMPFGTAEAVVVRNYIDWLISLPWSAKSDENHDVAAVKKVLDEDHYGLEKVKERILEYLAVRILKGGRGPEGAILCFVGPPGVGKTSLGKSIARALNRNYVRASLGGVRDEAEIRGHRRTYVGSLPGRVVQAMKKAKTVNPVFLLDEVDKMSMDFRGDPSAALLEVLDPEINSEFSDHYLEIPYDLSQVMFITTANLLHPVPPALLDRMEVINLPGYTEDEKIQIAVKFLIPKQMEQNGLKDGAVHISGGAIREIIRRYTREAGVRNLERSIASICRKQATNLLENRKAKKPAKLPPVTMRNLEKFLSHPKFRYGQIGEKDEVGVATGLAWTSTGGEVLEVEVNLMSGKGNLQLTGQLGDVMKESAHAALTYARSNAKRFRLAENFYKSMDIHLHVPEGGIPKDGPSAGVALAS